MGNVHFATKDRSKDISLYFDEYKLAPVVEELLFGNVVSVEWEVLQDRGYDISNVSFRVMVSLFDNSLFDYGYCCVSDQYNSSNLDRSNGGVRAIGLDASCWIPGFYWANYFGKYLCDLIGREKLMTTPGCHSNQLGSGILIVNRLPPDRWCDPEFIEIANSAMNHIGRHIFFERGKIATGRLFRQET